MTNFDGLFRILLFPEMKAINSDILSLFNNGVKIKETLEHNEVPATIASAHVKYAAINRQKASTLA